ncbi:MAG: hypothetical protein QXH30_03485 [Candidatus Bilamarchaeaceae archaeon]
MADHYKHNPESRTGFEERALITAENMLKEYAKNHVVEPAVRDAINLAVQRIAQNPYTTIGDVRKKVNEILKGAGKIERMRLPVAKKVEPGKEESDKFSRENVEKTILMHTSGYLMNYGIQLTTVGFNALTFYLEGKKPKSYNELNSYLDKAMTAMGYDVGRIAPGQKMRFVRNPDEDPQAQRNSDALFAYLSGEKGGKAAIAMATAEPGTILVTGKVGKTPGGEARAAAKEERTAKAQARAKKEAERLASLEEEKAAAAEAAAEKAEEPAALEIPKPGEKPAAGAGKPAVSDAALAMMTTSLPIGELNLKGPRGRPEGEAGTAQISAKEEAMNRLNKAAEALGARGYSQLTNSQKKVAKDLGLDKNPPEASGPLHLVLRGAKAVVNNFLYALALKTRPEQIGAWIARFRAAVAAG